MDLNVRDYLEGILKEVNNLPFSSSEEIFNTVVCFHPNFPYNMFTDSYLQSNGIREELLDKVPSPETLSSNEKLEYRVALAKIDLFMDSLDCLCKIYHGDTYRDRLKSLNEFTEEM